MADLGVQKNAVIKAIDSLKARIEVRQTIRANPKLGMSEFNAPELLSSELAQHGFTVERGIANMPTAFKVTLRMNGD